MQNTALFGVELFVIGSVGFYFWRKSLLSILMKVKDKNPRKFSEWADVKSGSPSAVGMLGLIGSESGWAVAVLLVVFLIGVQSLIVFGIVFLVAAS